jgi:hypothetical protein
MMDRITFCAFFHFAGLFVFYLFYEFLFSVVVSFVSCFAPFFISFSFSLFFSSSDEYRKRR